MTFEEWMEGVVHGFEIVEWRSSLRAPSTVDDDAPGRRAPD